MIKFDTSDIQRFAIAALGALILSTASIGAAVWPGHEAQFAEPTYAAAASVTDRAEA